MLKLLDLFSGIGGFSYGLEATGGFNTLAFVEINPFCQKVLKKWWPAVPLYSDINKVAITKGQFDVLCGGFPCQDVSIAKQGGQQSLLGDRSGLWYQYLRLISEGLPQWLLIENVENLRNRGMGLILSQLAAFGYDAEWHVIPAWGVGLPQQRERVWIVACLVRNGVERNSPFPLQGLRRVPWIENGGRASNWLGQLDPATPTLLRSSNGIPNYVDRINALGNSIVPKIAYYLGQAILEAENGA